MAPIRLPRRVRDVAFPGGLMAGDVFVSRVRRWSSDRAAYLALGGLGNDRVLRASGKHVVPDLLFVMRAVLTSAAGIFALVELTDAVTETGQPSMGARGWHGRSLWRPMRTGGEGEYFVARMLPSVRVDLSWAKQGYLGPRACVFRLLRIPCLSYATTILLAPRRREGF